MGRAPGAFYAVSGGAMEDRGFFKRGGLILPAVLAPAIEASLLAIWGLGDAISLAPQVTAPTPFGLFHDLRWISVYHNSWPVLALEILGVLFLRSLWVAWVVQRSWPDDEPPPMAAASLRAIIFLVIASVLLLPWVALLFGLALTHISFLFFAALPPVLAIALAIHGGAASHAAGRWWRWRPTAASLGWILASFLWLTLAGALMRSVPAPLAVPVAALAGLANARAWFGIVQSVVRRRERRRVRGLVPVAVGTTFLIVVGGSAIGFAVTTSDHAEPVPGLAAPAARPGQTPVLIAAGLYSRLEPVPPVELPRGHVAWRFSYAGVDEEGRPLPYGPADTLQPVTVSARRMAEQVDLLARAYGRPVTIVAESAGALVARTYITQFGATPARVSRLVALEPNSGVANVYLPARGEQGWGVGTGWVLRGVTGIIDEMVPFEASVDTPLLREIVDCRPLFQRVARTEAGQGIQEVSIEALADWVDRPVGRPAGVPVEVVSAPHSGLIERTGVQESILSLLEGADLGTAEASPPLARLVAAAASPWHVPRLDGALFPTEGCGTG